MKKSVSTNLELYVVNNALFSPSSAITGDSMTVDFPEHKSWKAAVSEMELAPSADSGKTFYTFAFEILTRNECI